MTKDVLLSISGLHQDVTGIEAQGDEPGSEPIEVIVPASYYEKDKINMTQYETPYGEMMIGVFTKDFQFEEQDEKITVHVNYALDINGDPVADCNIDIKITALER